MELQPPTLAQLSRIRPVLPEALIALDFDGTLAPIVADPERSAPVTGAVSVLRQLASAGAQIALITGRDAQTALRLSGLSDLPRLVISGLHGAELWRDGRLSTQDEPTGIARLRQQLPPLLAAADPAIWLEDKRLSLVVHTRRAADPDAALAQVTPAVTKAASEVGLKSLPGHNVAEIRLPGVSKADAVTALLDEGARAALYAGDDVGDYPAMSAVQSWTRRTGQPGLTIAVGDLAQLEEVADVRLPAPADLVSLLRQLR